MLHHAFTEREVEGLLRTSEGTPSTHRGGAAGHARSRHDLLSNAELIERADAMIEAEQRRRDQRRAEAAERGRKYRPGGPMYQLITAWSAWSDMVTMGCLALNSPQAQAGLVSMFSGQHAANGTRLEVCYIAPRDVPMRFVSGGATVRSLPVRQLTLIVDRADRDALRLHIQTFFGGMPNSAPYNGAVLSDQRGQELLGFVGYG